MAFESDFGKRTINELVLLHRNKQINLEPGFQRQSVWGITNRRKLIQSIVSEYPVPSIFLYCRNVRGKIIYDVIDGKQRLETIFMFMGARGFKSDRYDVRLDLGEGADWWDWSDIRRYAKNIRHQFESYRIQTVEVSGDLGEIVDLFVRINSTGKPLTPGEKRHARFYESRFLKSAESLVGRYRKYLLENKVLSKVQIDRMKGTELFSELLMSIHKGGPINKKTSLDRAIGNDSINANTLGRLEREFNKTMRLVKRMFPEIRQTRFRNSADFYSLFMLMWDMQREKYILTERKRNRMGFEMLRKLSTGVDALREKFRRASAVKPQPPYSDYLLTVQGDTDSAATRHRRAKILRNLLEPIFHRKDSKRTFTSEQRRILWNSDVKRQCAGCRKKLTWDDFTIDHVIAYARGGKTRLSNAQIMCRRCNSKKGAKRRRPKVTRKATGSRTRRVARRKPGKR